MNSLILLEPKIIKEQVKQDVQEKVTVVYEEKKELVIEEVMIGNRSIISSSSSSSSFSASRPLTPPNHHSFPTRTTSLFRRETLKLNDKRKNLTKRIKSVIKKNTV